MVFFSFYEFCCVYSENYYYLHIFHSLLSMAIIYLIFNLVSELADDDKLLAILKIAINALSPTNIGVWE